MDPGCERAQGQMFLSLVITLTQALLKFILQGGNKRMDPFHIGNPYVKGVILLVPPCNLYSFT